VNKFEKRRRKEEEEKEVEVTHNNCSSKLSCRICKYERQIVSACLRDARKEWLERISYYVILEHVIKVIVCLC
jgi:hypothetical protein